MDEKKTDPPTNLDQYVYSPSTATAPTRGLSKEQKTALTYIIDERRNTILLGPAGTGKTYIISRVQDNIHPNDLIITGTTGVSAVQYMHGRTLHSAVRTIPINSRFRQYTYADVEAKARTMLSKVKNRSTRNAAKYAWVRVLREARCLVIDEISMCSAYTFNCLDISLRVILEKPNLPFGGMQIVAVGDLLQLPHIVNNDIVIPHEPEQQDYMSPIYKSRVWNDGGFYVHLLKHNFRQCNDTDLRSILHDIRFDQNHGEVERRLMAQRNSGLSDEILKQAYAKKPFVLLRWRKRDVRRFNNMFIEEAKQRGRTSVHVSQTKDVLMETYNFPMRKLVGYGYNTEYSFLLKDIRKNHNMDDTDTEQFFFVGMHVMVTRNNPTLGVVNGDHGVVESFKYSQAFNTYLPVVRIKRGNESRIAYIKPDVYSFNVNNVDVVKIWVLSLMPCYAITIHKVQGVTFRDQTIVIDCNGLHRNKNMFYVALSRACYLNRVVLLDYQGFRQSREAIEYYTMLDQKAQGQPLLLKNE